MAWRLKIVSVIRGRKRGLPVSHKKTDKTGNISSSSSTVLGNRLISDDTGFDSLGLYFRNESMTSKVVSVLLRGVWSTLGLSKSACHRIEQPEQIQFKSVTMVFVVGA